VSSSSRRILVVLHGEASQLVLSSALGMALLAVRAFWTGERDYLFLVWNLFLAWIPYAGTLAIRALHARRASSLALAPLFLLWLGFLPNAPYLVTDFIHLRFRYGAPLWFDAVMLASFAWAGVALGAASLRGCSRVVRARGGAWAAAAFVPLVALATGFGVYLGRFVRLNTWDVAMRPGTVLVQVVSPLVHPFAHPRAWTMSFTFALFFAVVTLASGRARAGTRARS
jgi:uncharacterized membrane protein